MPHTVLIADDDSLVRTMTARVLRREGYGVIEAASGCEARAALDDHPEVDVLISDVEMTDMTGDVLAAQLRQSRPDLPVLLITGDDAFGMRQPPHTSLLLKPYSPVTVLQAVATLLEGRPFPS